jgi:hypothetical protein
MRSNDQVQLRVEQLTVICNLLLGHPRCNISDGWSVSAKRRHDVCTRPRDPGPAVWIGAQRGTRSRPRQLYFKKNDRNELTKGRKKYIYTEKSAIGHVRLLWQYALRTNSSGIYAFLLIRVFIKKVHDKFP